LMRDRAKVLEDQRRSDERTAQEEALQKQISAAREKEATISQVDEIASIKAAAAQRETELASSYMTDALKALKIFQTNEARMTQDYNLAREREMEDLYNDLTGLASQRDVAGFIARQRAGNLSLARGAQDFGIGAGRRAEDFAAQEAERTQSFEAQLAQERQNAADELAVKKEAGKAVVSQTAQLEKQLSDLKAQWAKEDQARERAAATADYNARITELLRTQQAYASTLGKVYAAPIAQVQQFAKTAKAWWDWLIGGVSAPAATKGGGAKVKANATGGIYDTPTLGLLGERPGYSDVVIPVSNSEGIEKAVNRVMGGSAGRGGIVYNDNRSFTVGDIASRKDIDAALEADRREMFEGLKMAVCGASGT
jgi:hypothetical protein